MNTDQIKGGWRALKGTVREQWGRVTGNRRDQAGGTAEQVAGRVQQGVGETRDAFDRSARKADPTR